MWSCAARSEHRIARIRRECPRGRADLVTGAQRRPSCPALRVGRERDGHPRCRLLAVAVSDRGQFSAAGKTEDRDHDHVRAVRDGGELGAAALAGPSMKRRPGGEVRRLTYRARPLQSVPVESDPRHRRRTGEARAVLARAQFPVKSMCSVLCSFVWWRAVVAAGEVGRPPNGSDEQPLSGRLCLVHRRDVSRFDEIDEPVRVLVAERVPDAEEHAVGGSQLFADAPLTQILRSGPQCSNSWDGRSLPSHQVSTARTSLKSSPVLFRSRPD